GEDMDLDQLAARFGLARAEGENDKALLARIAAAANLTQLEDEPDSDFIARIEASIEEGADVDEDVHVDVKVSDEQEEATMHRPRMRATDMEDLGKSVVASERKRISDIGRLCRIHNIDPSQEAKMVANGSTLEQARGTILELLAQQTQNQMPGGHISVQSNGPQMRTAMAGALLHRAGASQ